MKAGETFGATIAEDDLRDWAAGWGEGGGGHNAGVNIYQTDAQQHTQIHTASLQCVVTLAMTKMQVKADVQLIGVLQRGGRVGPTIVRCYSRQERRDQEATCSLHQLGPPPLHSSVKSCIYATFFHKKGDLS